MENLSKRLRRGIVRWPDGGLKFNDAIDVMEQAADLLDECEKALFAWRGAYVVGEAESLKAACDAADATLAKLRSNEQ